MARKNLMKGFKKPKGITFEHSHVEPDAGKFIAYPFERGFGTTIGNTLRRILLSSIQGYAATAVKFTSFNEEGVPHLSPVNSNRCRQWLKIFPTSSLKLKN